MTQSLKSPRTYLDQSPEVRARFGRIRERD